MQHGGWGGILVALLILGIGIADLGKSMGWWEWSIPFWPVVFILVGAWLLLHGLEKKFVRQHYH